MNEITYRQAKRSDINRLMLLINTQYARKKSHAYFEWQFFDSPLPTALFVAIANKEIIGMFGLQKKILSNGLKIGQLIDLLILPRYRGRKIFSTLADKTINFFSDLDGISVLPNQNGMHACKKKLGMKNIAKIDTLFLDIGGFSLNNFLNRKNNILNQPNDRLIEFSKDEIWRKWRFGLCPEFKYKKISLDKNNFTIIKIFKDPKTKIKYGDIVDIKFIRNDENKFIELFKITAEKIFNDDISFITTWALPHTSTFKLLSILGFKSRAQERYFCLKIFDKKFNELYNINNWGLTQADTEML